MRVKTGCSKFVVLTLRVERSKGMGPVKHIVLRSIFEREEIVRALSTDSSAWATQSCETDLEGLMEVRGIHRPQR